MRHQARLKAELVRIQIREGKQSKLELARTGTEGVERYVRWNPNTDLHRSGDWSLAALHRHLAEKGMKPLESAEWPVPAGKYFVDPHLGEQVLVFPGNSTWWVGDEWYEAGAVILQDKASCFPARVLMEGWSEEEGECIDAT
jgi:putative methyltransferase